MGYEVKVVLDSVSAGAQHRLTTFQLTFPRFLLAEFNTHRMYSRSSASSRATPVSGRIKAVSAEPFIPADFAHNKAGMIAGEIFDEEAAKKASQTWLDASSDACLRATELMQQDVHKQWANRVIEPYSWHTVVVTATDWSNGFALRDHPAASPEIRTITKMMKEAMKASIPKNAHYGYWHLPYVYNMSETGLIDELDITEANRVATPTCNWLDVLCKVSVGRCAATSYNRQEVRDFLKDLARFDLLKKNAHLSPFEHVARPMTRGEYDHIFAQPEVVWDEEEGEWQRTGKIKHYCGNFEGWIQIRKQIRNEHDFSLIGV